MGGDSDTLACTTGAMAEALYGGVPEWIAKPVWARLDEPLRQVTQRFRQAFALP